MGVLARYRHRGPFLNKPGSSPVLCILPRGEAIRNFAYSSALAELHRRNRCVLLSVKPNEEIWRFLGGLCADLHMLEEFEDRYPARILRELLDVAHGRWLWSEAAKERWRLRELEASTPMDQLKRLAKTMAIRPFLCRRGLNLLSRLERTASRVWRPTDHYLRLFRQLRPSLVFNGSHVHSRNALQPVQAAQWLGIPTATFIFSWDNLTSQGRVIPPYDYYLVWNEAIKQQFLNIYDFVRPEQVFVTGTPQFDSHFDPTRARSREEYCRQVGADPRRPLVFYATGMDNHMPGEPLIVEGIAAMLERMTDLGPPQLLVRVYPKDRHPERFDAVKQRCPGILFPSIPWGKAAPDSLAPGCSPPGEYAAPRSGGG